MERFERVAEEKKRRQTKQEVEIVVEGTAEIIAGTQGSKRTVQTS